MQCWTHCWKRSAGWLGQSEMQTSSEPPGQLFWFSVVCNYVSVLVSNGFLAYKWSADVFCFHRIVTCNVYTVVSVCGVVGPGGEFVGPVPGKVEPRGPNLMSEYVT